MRIIEPADEQYSWCRNEPQIDREECVEANLLRLLHRFKFSFNTAYTHDLAIPAAPQPFLVASFMGTTIKQMQRS